MKAIIIFRYLTLFLMIVQGSLVHAQDVSVMLSIKKEKAAHFAPIALDNDSIPFLIVEYENRTDSSLYLHRVANSSENEFPLLPIIGVYSCLRNTPNLYELAIASKGRNSGKRYSVTLQSCFEVMTEKHRFETEWIINVYRFLSSIEESIAGNNRLFTDYYYWEQNDFSQESVLYYEEHKDDKGISTSIDSIMMLDRYRKNLVFLPPRSKVIHRYNLIGFWYVGGDYLFKLPDDYQPPRSVYDKTFRHLIDLPESIDGFKLYKGTFVSNEVLLRESSK